MACILCLSSHHETHQCEQFLLLPETVRRTYHSFAARKDEGMVTFVILNDLAQQMIDEIPSLPENKNNNHS